jgi:hypothetical protein
MKLETLDTLNDDDLRSVIERAQHLLEKHDKERKEKAVIDARTILEAAGLTLKDVAAKGGHTRSSKSPVYRGGHRYQHPTKKELVWMAKGQKPGWLRLLEKEGSRAVELPGDDSPKGT